MALVTGDRERGGGRMWQSVSRRSERWGAAMTGRNECSERGAEDM